MATRKKSKKSKQTGRDDSPARTRKLTKVEVDRYQSFVDAYLAVGQSTYLNATRSGLQAGYSETSAKTFCGQLLKNPTVQEMMRKVRDARMAASTIATPEEVLESLTSLLRNPYDAVVDKLVDDEGKFLSPNQLSSEVLSCIVGVKSTTKTKESKDGTEETTTTWEYKLADRIKASDRIRAAELLAKHHGLFEKDNEQSKPDPAKMVFVNMPNSELSINEWSKQAELVLADHNAQKALPAPAQDSDIIDVTPEPAVGALDFLNID